MKQTVSLTEFIQAFENMGRKDSFTEAQLEALFYHLEELEADTGVETELDVVAICCDYSGYASALEAVRELCDGWADPERLSDDPDSDDYEPIQDYEERCEEEAREYLNDETDVIDCDDGTIVIRDF